MGDAVWLSSGFMAGNSSTSCERANQVINHWHPLNHSYTSFFKSIKCSFISHFTGLQEFQTNLNDGELDKKMLRVDRSKGRKQAFFSPLLPGHDVHGTFTLMLLESVRNMVRRSMPIPQPAVGGSPYSRAVQKVSSMNMASSSPSALA